MDVMSCYSVRVYLGLSDSFNIFNVNSIQNLVSMLNLRKYKLLHGCDVMVEHNIIINDSIYNNMELRLIKITTTVDIIADLVKSHSEYFESEINKAFPIVGKNGLCLFFHRLVAHKFNITFQKNNKAISSITIDIEYIVDTSLFTIYYEDRTEESHMIKGLTQEELYKESWKVPDIIRLFETIFNEHLDILPLERINIATATNVIAELVQSHSEYFESEMNKIFRNYNFEKVFSIANIQFHKLVTQKFNIKLEKNNKPISFIRIYIYSLCSLNELSSFTIEYDDGTHEKHLITGLSRKDVDIKSWKVPDIINFFDIIFAVQQEIEPSY